MRDGGGRGLMGLVKLVGGNVRMKRGGRVERCRVLLCLPIARRRGRRGI